MGIYQINSSNAAAVAELMAAIKPDWWDFEGASQQLLEVSALARLVGWYMGEPEAPRGVDPVRGIRGLFLFKH